MFIGRTDGEAEPPILWPPDMKSWLIGKDPDTGKDGRWEEKGMTERKVVGWHHWLDGHEFEQALGVGDGQGSLTCCCPWLQKVGHDWATGLNWTELGEAKNLVSIHHSLVYREKEKLAGQTHCTVLLSGLSHVSCSHNGGGKQSTPEAGQEAPSSGRVIQVPSILLTETAGNGEMFIVSQSRSKKMDLYQRQ